MNEATINNQKYASIKKLDLFVFKIKQTIYI